MVGRGPSRSWSSLAGTLICLQHQHVWSLEGLGPWPAGPLSLFLSSSTIRSVSVVITTYWLSALRMLLAITTHSLGLLAFWYAGSPSQERIPAPELNADIQSSSGRHSPSGGLCGRSVLPHGGTGYLVSQVEERKERQILPAAPEAPPTGRW